MRTWLGPLFFSVSFAIFEINLTSILPWTTCDSSPPAGTGYRREGLKIPNQCEIGSVCFYFTTFSTSTLCPHAAVDFCSPISLELTRLLLAVGASILTVGAVSLMIIMMKGQKVDVFAYFRNTSYIIQIIHHQHLRSLHHRSWNFWIFLFICLESDSARVKKYKESNKTLFIIFKF